MKLASYEDGSRDGLLVVVSRDLKSAHYATGVATRMQHLLDDWGFISPQLQDLYDALNQGKLRHAFDFDNSKCAAPLPRAYAWFGPSSGDQAAFPGRAPRIRFDASTGFMPPKGNLPHLAPESEAEVQAGLALEGQPPLDHERSMVPAVGAGVAVLTGDVGPGVAPDPAIDSVRLVVLFLQAGDRSPGRRSFTAFSPVALTPDELGPNWQGGRMNLPLELQRNGRLESNQDTASGMRHHFGELIAEAARNHSVAAGSIVGSGALLKATDAIRVGDRWCVDVRNTSGATLFGTIDQTMVTATTA